MSLRLWSHCCLRTQLPVDAFVRACATSSVSRWRCNGYGGGDRSSVIRSCHGHYRNSLPSCRAAVSFTMLVVFAVVLVLMPLLVQGGNNTITDEVFFDIKVDATEPWTGRIVIGVFGDALPITSFNFVSLAKGFQHREELWTYKNCMVHRIVPDFLIQTGDVVYRDGRGGRSVYAPFFIDEAFTHSHRAAGYVANANVGPDSNASQFYITLTKARWLDNRNVVFGKVIKGMDVVERLAKVQTDASGHPRVSIFITNSGTQLLSEPYDLTESDLDKDSDIRPGYVAPDFVEL